MNIEQLTQLARCNGLHTMTFRPNEDPVKYELLRNDVIDHTHSRIDSSSDCCSHPKEGEGEDFLIHHNTSNTYINSYDFDLFKTAILATS